MKFTISNFSYELTQIPTSLREMRKANKALLTAILTKEVTSVKDTPGCAYVLDGGALLHRVRWKSGLTYYGDIVCQYSSYINQKYGICTVIFDHGLSMKDHDHMRRIGRVSANVEVSDVTIFQGKQTAFLSNERKQQEQVH